MPEFGKKAVRYRMGNPSNHVWVNGPENDLAELHLTNCMGKQWRTERPGTYFFSSSSLLFFSSPQHCLFFFLLTLLLFSHDYKIFRRFDNFRDF